MIVDVEENKDMGDPLSFTLSTRTRTTFHVSRFMIPHEHDPRTGPRRLVPHIARLFVDFVDKPALLQLAHDAVVDDVVDFERGARFAREGLLDLYFSALARPQRHAVVELDVGVVRIFE